VFTKLVAEGVAVSPDQGRRYIQRLMEQSIQMKDLPSLTEKQLTKQCGFSLGHAKAFVNYHTTERQMAEENLINERAKWDEERKQLIREKQEEIERRETADRFASEAKGKKKHYKQICCSLREQLEELKGVASGRQSDPNNRRHTL